MGKSKKVFKWLGLGLLVMWSLSITHMSDMIDSHSLFNQIFGYIGLLAMTVTGIGLMLHIDKMDGISKALDGRLQNAEEASHHWREQSEAWQHHHEDLRLESLEHRKQIADAERVIKFWQKQALESLPDHPIPHP